MRLTICLAAAAALCACSKSSEAPPAADNSADTNLVAPAATAAAFQINETSWTFTDKDGKNVKESVDTAGNYIANTTDGKHLDHGTAVMKDGKACFTSAMDKKGEICWTTKTVAVGESMETTSDKGEKLTVTRVAYEPLSMPK
jgi:hypothetical protein